MEGDFRARHLAIVGLGLMGGSLALALRPYAESITGIDKNPSSLDYAQKQGIVDIATDDLKSGVENADVVLLAARSRDLSDCERANRCIFTLKYALG